MATLTEMIDRVQDCSDQTVEILESILKDTSEIYIGIHQKQLSQGFDRNGGKTELQDNPDGGYRNITKAIKLAESSGIGAIIDHVTLFMTGAMYQSETLGVTSKDIQLGFHTEYSDKLLARTGDEPMGLDASSRDEYIHGIFIEELRPRIVHIMKVPFI